MYCRDMAGYLYSGHNEWELITTILSQSMILQSMTLGPALAQGNGTHHVLVVGMVGVHVSLQLLGGGEGLATVTGEVGLGREPAHPAHWRAVAQSGHQAWRQGAELVE